MQRDTPMSFKLITNTTQKKDKNHAFFSHSKNYNNAVLEKQNNTRFINSEQQSMNRRPYQPELYNVY